MLSAGQYEVERAIYDRAEAIFRELAPKVFNRGGAIPEAVTSHPDWRACDNAMRGRVEQYEICTNPGEIVVAYLDKPDARGVHPVTTWMGDPIGAARCIASRRVNSFTGTHMGSYRARIAGRDYHGRGFGSGMSIVLRETSASKRRRNASEEA